MTKFLSFDQICHFFDQKIHHTKYNHMANLIKSHILGNEFIALRRFFKYPYDFIRRDEFFDQKVAKLVETQKFCHQRFNRLISH